MFPPTWARVFFFGTSGAIVEEGYCRGPGSLTQSVTFLSFWFILPSLWSFDPVANSITLPQFGLSVGFMIVFYITHLLVSVHSAVLSLHLDPNPVPLQDIDLLH